MKTIIVFIMLAIISFTSCKKSEDAVSLNSNSHPENTLLVSFDAEEQVSVADYRIELSEDGSKFTEAGIILADSLPQTKYSIKVDVSKYQRSIYMRIKSNDIDGKFDHSKIITVRLN